MCFQHLTSPNETTAFILKVILTEKSGIKTLPGYVAGLFLFGMVWCGLTPILTRTRTLTLTLTHATPPVPRATQHVQNTRHTTTTHQYLYNLLVIRSFQRREFWTINEDELKNHPIMHNLFKYLMPCSMELIALLPWRPSNAVEVNGNYLKAVNKGRVSAFVEDIVQFVLQITYLVMLGKMDWATLPRYSCTWVTAWPMYAQRLAPASFKHVSQLSQPNRYHIRACIV